MVSTSSFLDAQNLLKLDGIWTFALDPHDAGERDAWYKNQLDGTIVVPGSWAEQGIGDPPAAHYLWGWNSQFEYEGAGWYSREIDIPEKWHHRRIELRLNGVRWRSRVWLDGDYVGEQDSLSVDHRHDLTAHIKVGQKQLLSIQIDNRMLYPLEESHINSLQTATRWGGITGGIELTAYPEYNIIDLKCRPNVNDCCFDFDAQLSQFADNQILRVRVTDPTDGTVFENSSTVEASSVSISIDLAEQAHLWSDEDPHLYQLECLLEENGEVIDRVEGRTGLREIAVVGKQILLNGKPIFLRGYVDCCIFPLTGYPSWDIEHYRRQFRIARSYGFNHVRLHSWTPPEPFWQAADEYGMLVQTELPHWSKHYITSETVPPEDTHQYLSRELEAIVDALNLHPSWVMLSYGNELVAAEGHERLLELVAHGRSLDTSRLYTDQTGFGRLPAPNRDVDFLIQSCNWHPPKKIYDAASNDTTQDFTAITALTDRPLIGHEHGQFTMYVRPGEAEKYTGSIRPTWLESIQESFEVKGISDRVVDYIRASGIHMLRAYKENIERARRTSGLSGIQLLDIRDFPGQGHATTGILDMFWDSKELVEPESFAQFNSAVVLLMRTTTPTFYSGDPIQVEIEVSNFSGDNISGKLEWKLHSNDKKYQGEVDIPDAENGVVSSLAHLCITTDSDSKARHWTLSVRLGTAENHWELWTFPNPQKPQHNAFIRSRIQSLRHLLPDIDYHDDFGSHMLTWDTVEPQLDRTCRLAISDRLSLRLLQYLHDGGSVWLMPGQVQLYDFVRTRYLPPFWSYLHFPDNVSSVMGMIINEHPMLRNFPHDGFSNWQWYNLVNDTPAICLDSVPSLEPIVEVVDNFNRAKRLAYAFEAQVGQGCLFVSTWKLFDINVVGRPEASFLLSSMVDYLTSSEFAPEIELSVSQLLGLFKLTNSNVSILE